MSGILLPFSKRPRNAGASGARHRRIELPCVTDPIRFGPLIRHLAAEAGLDMKNKAYRASPVGETVGRYLNEIQFAGLARNTLDSYEQVLAWLAAAHDDLPEVGAFCRPGGTEMLEEFLHTNWGSSAETTRSHRWTVLNQFFRWCVEKEQLRFNPMSRVRRPRSPKRAKKRQAYEQTIVKRLVMAQEPLRDRCACGLLRLALRKMDLGLIQLRDVDLARDVIWLRHPKGGGEDVLPIVFDDLRSDLAAHLAERTLEAGKDPGDEFLLYPRNRRERPMDPSSVHRWFKRCLSNAGLAESIVMHELRHTAADNVWRESKNIVMAQKLLRHKSPATTADYLHPTEDDLRAALRVVEEAYNEC